MYLLLSLLTLLELQDIPVLLLKSDIKALDPVVCSDKESLRTLSLVQVCLANGSGASTDTTDLETELLEI